MRLHELFESHNADEFTRIRFAGLFFEYKVIQTENYYHYIVRFSSMGGTDSFYISSANSRMYDLVHFTNPKLKYDGLEELQAMLKDTIYWTLYDSKITKDGLQQVINKRKNKGKEPNVVDYSFVLLVQQGNIEDVRSAIDSISPWLSENYDMEFLEQEDETMINNQVFIQKYLTFQGLHAK